MCFKRGKNILDNVRRLKYMTFLYSAPLFLKKKNTWRACNIRLVIFNRSIKSEEKSRFNYFFLFPPLGNTTVITVVLNEI